MLRPPMQEIEVPVIAEEEVPFYASDLAAGADVKAKLKTAIHLEPGASVLVPTGLRFAIPDGYEIQVRPRSGLAFKHGITVLNSPGTIDADYRGELKVLLINLSKEDFAINDGERIAQVIVAKHERVDWELVEQLMETERGAGGFGHTGKH